MKVLQVSSYDLVGERFNGQYVIRYLNDEKNSHLGHSGSQLVWQKDGDNPQTQKLLRFKGVRFMQRIGNKLEDIFSIRALLHPSSFLLPIEKFFRSADVVHYQLIYWPNFFSLLALPFLTWLKPSVWTLHDMFPITGHCTYPFTCDRWLSGCGSCPDLKVSFSVRKDRTHLIWKIKRFIYRHSRLQLVVASKFMYDRVSRSPLTKDLPLTIVPFGLDLSKFCQGDSRAAKERLGIGPDELVISFRATTSEFKGFEYVREVLRKLQPNRKICLLSFNSGGMLEEFKGKFSVVDLGWVQTEAQAIHAYQAADFFIMPSLQEAFGMMAMEAMACSKPVVVFDGTSLPEVVGGPEIGVVVRQGDVAGLQAAVNRLVQDDQFRQERSDRSRRFAEENYSLDLHVSRLLEVYEKTKAEFKRRV